MREEGVTEGIDAVGPPTATSGDIRTRNGVEGHGNDGVLSI